MPGAIENFRPEHGVPFEAYAYYRVRGAVLNGLADYAGEFGKCSEKQSSVQAYLMEVDQNGEEQGRLFVVIDATVGFALSRLLELGAATEGGSQDPLSAYVGERDGIHLCALAGRLPERERWLITEHYQCHRKIKELASTIGGQSPAGSQLHYQVLRRPRALYEAL